VFFIYISYIFKYTVISKYIRSKNLNFSHLKLDFKLVISHMDNYLSYKENSHII